MNILKGFLDGVRTGSVRQGLAGAFGAPLLRLPTTTAFRKTCNPFTDLANDPELENTLCEVFYIHLTLRHYMLPTTLPGDNLELCSSLLRSLETRRDLTPLVLEETRIHNTLMGITHYRKPTSHEPPELHARAVALEKHWRSYMHNTGPLAPGYANCHSPPLIEEDYKLSWTLEQAAEAEAEYRLWRTDRDRKVSYLKRNPPEPIHFRAVTRGQIASDAVWDVLPRTATGTFSMSGDRRMKLEPLYKGIRSQAVPLDWVNPDSPPSFSTRDEKRRWEKKRKERIERKEKQVKYLKETMAEEGRA